MPNRNLFAAFRLSCLLVTLGSALPVAYAAQGEFCSAGKGNRPAKLIPLEGNADYEFQLGRDATETPVHSGSVGTGLNGSVYVGTSGDTEVMYFSELWLDANVDPEV